MARKESRPPVWFGILFVIAGSIPLFVGKPSAGVPIWVAQTSAMIFVFAGVGLICQSLGSESRAKVAFGLMMIAFLTVFNWVGFGPGERMGTVSSGAGGVSVSKGGTDVRVPFAIAAGLMDIILIFCLFNSKLFKKEKKK